MKVYLNEVTGIADAVVSLMMSRKTWTREKEMAAREIIEEFTDRHGFKDFKGDPTSGKFTQFNKFMDSLEKYGIVDLKEEEMYGHTTLMRYIDLSFTVEGLHRGAQDDFDSHAKRLDSRIVRSSTRLAKFTDGEKSEWYKDKILYTDEVLGTLGIELPDTMEQAGTTYVKRPWGYVREDMADDPDTLRGLYPLAIPSNFIFKVQYPEYCHIYQHRNSEGNAAPELKEMMEASKRELDEKAPAVLGNNVKKLRMQSPYL